MEEFPKLRTTTLSKPDFRTWDLKNHASNFVHFIRTETKNCWLALSCVYIYAAVVALLSRVQLFCSPMDCNSSAAPWIVVCQAQALLSMGFYRQENWSGLPFPSPGYLPHPGIKPGSPALQADALTSECIIICVFSDWGTLKLFLIFTFPNDIAMIILMYFQVNISKFL